MDYISENGSEYDLQCDVCDAWVKGFKTLQELEDYKVKNNWEEIITVIDVFDKCQACIKKDEFKKEELKRLKIIKEEKKLNWEKEYKEKQNIIEELNYCELSGKTFRGDDDITTLIAGQLGDVIAILAMMIKNISEEMKLSVGDLLEFISERLGNIYKTKENTNDIGKLVLKARKGELSKELASKRRISEKESKDLREYLHKEYIKNPNRDYYEMEEDLTLATLRWKPNNNYLMKIKNYPKASIMKENSSQKLERILRRNKYLKFQNRKTRFEIYQLAVMKLNQYKKQDNNFLF